MSKTKTKVFMIENCSEGPRFILEDIDGRRALLVEVNVGYDSVGPIVSPLWELGEVEFDRDIDNSIQIGSLPIIEKAPDSVVAENLELRDGTTLEMVLEILTF